VTLSNSGQLGGNTILKLIQNKCCEAFSQTESVLPQSNGRVNSANLVLSPVCNECDDVCPSDMPPLETWQLLNKSAFCSVICDKAVLPLMPIEGEDLAREDILVNKHTLWCVDSVDTPLKTHVDATPPSAPPSETVCRPSVVIKHSRADDACGERGPHSKLLTQLLAASEALETVDTCSLLLDFTAATASRGTQIVDAQLSGPASVNIIGGAGSNDKDFNRSTIDGVNKDNSNGDNDASSYDIGSENVGSNTEVVFLALNVCGLQSKLLCPEFVSYFSQYDFVVFTETKLDDTDCVDVPGYTSFCKNRMKYKRKSGGIVLYVKNSLVQYVMIMESEDRRDRIDASALRHYKFVDYDLSADVLFCKVDKQVFGKDILIGGVYYPPENSPYFDRQAFKNLENSVAFLEFDSICLMGDFNARTGVLSDVDLDESVCSGDEFWSTAGDFICMQPPERFSLDKSVNFMGLELLDFCKTMSCCIVNGRVGQPDNCKLFTCKDASVVDYVVVSLDLFRLVTDFKINEFCELFSDVHCAVSFSVRSTSLAHNLIEDINCDVNPLSRPRWFADSGIRFKEQLDSAEINILINKFKGMLNAGTCSEILQVQLDGMCSRIGELFRNAADEAGLMKKKNAPNIRKRRQDRKNDCQPWFDTECEKSRKLFMKAKNTAVKDKSTVAQERKVQSSKLYKKQLKISFKKYQLNLAKKIRSLRSNNPTNYWKLINGSKQEKNEMYNKITCEAFYEHFKNLGATEQDDAATEGVNNDTNDEVTNELLDDLFTVKEVEEVLRTLKNNKACGIDLITNELLKAASSELIQLITLFFNIVLQSGKVPEEWSIGIIKPLYKQKGDKTNTNNYRGISILSCFGKLFTCLINNRLCSYVKLYSLLGEEQAGFRSGYSVSDHIFTLHSLIEFFLSKKKRLYCVFIDYEKAFDLVDRAFLWQKLLDLKINGKILRVIQDLYVKAKSQVQWNNTLSDYFSCTSGVRQGENLSPLLFALFLNDLKDFLDEKMVGLTSVRTEALNLNMDEDYVDILYRMFMLLYADDTVIFAESVEDLQTALDSMYDYCLKFKLKVNTAKTKAVVFSRGKIRKLPELFYNGIKLEVVFDFQYLGININYNGSFKPAQKCLYNKACKAMFALIRKMKKLLLPIDVQIELFDRTIVPILLYGSEIWCPQMCELANKLQIRFFKIILKLGKSTPTHMILGELGRLPLDILAKQRMLNFWYKIINNVNEGKLSSVMYKFLFQLKNLCGYKTAFLDTVEKILNDLGLSNIWIHQKSLIMLPSPAAFKATIKQLLNDQYVQGWMAELSGNELYYNYRMFKDTFVFEKYITVLPFNLASVVMKFRLLNHRMPIQTGRFFGISRGERICLKCNSGDLGDEFHYLLVCTHFHTDRQKLIKPYYWRRPNSIKFQQLLANGRKSVLLKVAGFIKIILRNMV